MGSSTFTFTSRGAVTGVGPIARRSARQLCIGVVEPETNSLSFRVVTARGALGEDRGGPCSIGCGYAAIGCVVLARAEWRGRFLRVIGCTHPACLWLLRASQRSIVASMEREAHRSARNVVDCPAETAQVSQQMMQIWHRKVTRAISGAASNAAAPISKSVC